jgi:hypothetical protein
MKNLSIQSFFLASSTQSVFPLAKFFQAGILGDVFFADFSFPFQFSDHFLPLIQEKMKSLVKENLKTHVFEMIPKVGKEFLSHHHQKQLALEVDLEAPFVWIVQLEDQFFLSEKEVVNHPATEWVKIFSFKEFLDESENKITRIYGVFHQDQNGLKKVVKLAQNYLKRDLFSKLNKQGLVDQFNGGYFLRDQGIYLQNDLLKELQPLFEVFHLKYCNLTKEMIQKDSSFVTINSDEELFFKRGPFFDLMHLETSQYLISFWSVVEQTKNFNNDLKRFVDHFTLFLKNKSIPYDMEIASGKEVEELFSLFPSSLRRIKARKKGTIEVFSSHPLNFKKIFLRLEVEVKEQQIILKGNALPQLLGLIGWMEEAKFILSSE